MVLKESCLDLVLKQGFKQGQVHLYSVLMAYRGLREIMQEKVIERKW